MTTDNKTCFEQQWICEGSKFVKEKVMEGWVCNMASFVVSHMHVVGIPCVIYSSTKHRCLGVPILHGSQAATGPSISSSPLPSLPSGASAHPQKPINRKLWLPGIVATWSACLTILRPTNLPQIPPHLYILSLTATQSPLAGTPVQNNMPPPLVHTTGDHTSDVLVIQLADRFLTATLSTSSN